MSEPVSNSEIEDVLSSIRRLISADAGAAGRPETAAAPASENKPASHAKLVLTPSHMVSDPAASAPPVPPAPTAEAIVEPVPQPRNLRPVPNAPKDRVAQRISDAADLAESATPARDEVPEFLRRGATGETPRASEPTLEDRIAELEAALGQQMDEWEPDGSEYETSDFAFPAEDDAGSLRSFTEESENFRSARRELGMENGGAFGVDPESDLFTPSDLKVAEPQKTVVDVEDAEVVETAEVHQFAPRRDAELVPDAEDAADTVDQMVSDVLSEAMAEVTRLHSSSEAAPETADADIPDDDFWSDAADTTPAAASATRDPIPEPQSEGEYEADDMEQAAFDPAEPTFDLSDFVAPTADPVDEVAAAAAFAEEDAAETLEEIAEDAPLDLGDVAESLSPGAADVDAYEDETALDSAGSDEMIWRSTRDTVEAEVAPEPELSEGHTARFTPTESADEPETLDELEAEVTEAAPEPVFEMPAPEAELEVAEAEVAEDAEAALEAVEPEVAEVEVTGAAAEVIEPEVAEVEPEVAEPEVIEPEAIEPEVIEPEVAEAAPEAIEPEVAEAAPETIEPEVAEAAPEVAESVAEDTGTALAAAPVAPAPALDETMVREMVGDIVRSELKGELGEQITRNVRKLIRREIYQALASREFD